MEKIKLLLYCCKQPLYLVKNECDGYFYTMDERTLNDYKNVETYNGKIVAECDFEVEEIKYIHIKERDEIGILHNAVWYEYKGKNIWLSECDLSIKSCLTADEIDDYLINKSGYAIYIKNLHIFKKPRELSYYFNENEEYIEKAPQNMMYCYGKNTGEKYILISIRPEWICKILNGEKTIEIRKRVLKEMI